MKIKTPYYYKDFRCIASECTDTCCAGWEVDVDAESAQYYAQVEGEFGDRIKEVMIIHEDGEANFTLRENGWCPFLNKHLLCDLYTALGEEHLCETCANFPRFYGIYGQTMEVGIALSCITACELIMKDDTPVSFVVEEDDREPVINDMDPMLYMYLSNARQLMYNIARDRKLSIHDRYMNALMIALDVQKGIDSKRYEKNFYVEHAYSKLDMAVGEGYRSFWSMFDGMEIISDRWRYYEKLVLDMYESTDYAKLLSEFEEYMKSRMYEYEHLLMYFLYRYVLKAVDDSKLLSKVKFAVLGYIFIRDMGMAVYYKNGGTFAKEEQVDLMHIYSREVEHSYENYDAFMKLLEQEDRLECLVLKN